MTRMLTQEIKMLPFEDPDHDGNSLKYHTGKACRTEGCKEPAGTFWSPHWCQAHNTARMHRITASLEDMTKKAEVSALIDKATEELRAWAYEQSKTIRAMVLASGGQITIKNSDLDRKTSGESTNYGTDTTTYRVYG